MLPVRRTTTTAFSCIVHKRQCDNAGLCCGVDVVVAVTGIVVLIVLVVLALVIVLVGVLVLVGA